MVKELIPDEIYRINAKGALTFGGSKAEKRGEILGKSVRFSGRYASYLKSKKVFEWVTPPPWSTGGYLFFNEEEVDEL